MNSTLIIGIIIGVIALVTIVIVLVLLSLPKSEEKTEEKKEEKAETKPEEKKEEKKEEKPEEKKETVREYVFHQGFDSNGNDITQAKDLANNASSLKKKCDITPKCVAFNTNGWLKTVVSSPEKWTKWTSDPDKGMYILKDINK